MGVGRTRSRHTPRAWTCTGEEEAPKKSASRHATGARCLISRRVATKAYQMPRRDTRGKVGKTSKEVKARYQKRTYTRVEVQLHRELDKDIIDRLDEEPSRQGFFKTAAREKIAREEVGE